MVDDQYKFARLYQNEIIYKKMNVSFTKPSVSNDDVKPNSKKLNKSKRESLVLKLNDLEHYETTDLNYKLTTYVDLKYSKIWSDEFIKTKKNELKQLDTYFRMVKQGSQLIYLSFHIILIFIILLMASIRQSLISLGYVFILIPAMKNGSEVLDQRTINQYKLKNELSKEIEELGIKEWEETKVAEKT